MGDGVQLYRGRPLAQVTTEAFLSGRQAPDVGTGEGLRRNFLAGI